MIGSKMSTVVMWRNAALFNSSFDQHLEKE
jgi:hypothetical protein